MNTEFTSNPVSGQEFKTLFRVAGTLALLIVLLGLIDAFTSMGHDMSDNRSIAIIEWFALFQSNRFAAFSNLGVINITTLSLSIPVYAAYNLAFRKDRTMLVPLASVLFFIGAAVYLSSNSVFALFALSQQYVSASEAQKILLETAGQALLAQGADLTPGTFVGLFTTQVAGLLMASVMLRGTVFRRWIGAVGLTGYSVMAVFFILTAFVPSQFNTAMLVAAPGALLMMAFQVMVALRFFSLAKQG